MVVTDIFKQDDTYTTLTVDVTIEIVASGNPDDVKCLLCFNLWFYALLYLLPEK